MDIPGLIERLVQQRAFNRITNNPNAQFGPSRRRYLGATLLPERNVQENEYTEDTIRYRTVVANDATRYSPVQIKEGAITGSVAVRLGEIDIGSELTSRDYDALLKLLANAGGRPTMQAMQQVLSWTENTLNLPLREKMEVQRWQAIVDAVVVQTGDNNFEREFAYSNPDDHRIAAGSDWANDANDPYEDILDMMDFAAGKGYTIRRIITTTPVVSLLANNAKIQERVGRFKIADLSTVVGIPGRASLARINEMVSEDGLPPFEKYDLQYRTQTGSGYFLKRDVMVMIGTTGVDAQIDRGDEAPLIVPDVIGYQGIGRAAGQSVAGIPTVVKFHDGKAPHIEGQAWATTLPVIQDPEAIFVIKDINIP